MYGLRHMCLQSAQDALSLVRDPTRGEPLEMRKLIASARLMPSAPNR